VATRIVGIASLCILSGVVLLGVILPSVALALGLGVQVPSHWLRYQRYLTLYSHPWLALLVGASLLLVLAWGIWTLAKA
jgi:hypothetical protein